MKIPSLKRVGKGLLSFIFTGFVFSFFYYAMPGIYRKATTGSWDPPAPIVDPSLCYSSHGVLIYDNDKFRPPDKCPARETPLPSEGGE